MWNVNLSSITEDNRFFSSVIYEEYGTDELLINFVTAKIKTDIDEEQEIDYPQQPNPQEWIVDYPLLAYRTFNPMNREIAIIHMALNMP